MSYETLVDQSSTGTNVRGKGAAFSKVSDVHDARVSGYTSSHQHSGVEVHERRSAPTTDVSRRVHERTSVGPAIRDEIRRAIDRAEYEVDRMIVAANGQDFIELSNSGFSFRDALAELWNLRKARDDDWADLLNLVQGALAKEEFERLSSTACSALKEIVVNHLRPAATESDDIERAIQLLRRAGLDPWKGISADGPMHP